MAVTTQDLNDFAHFADERIRSGTAETLVSLANEWEAQQKPDAIAIDEETLATLAAAFPDVDDKQRLQEAMSRKGGITTQDMLSKATLAAEAQQR